MPFLSCIRIKKRRLAPLWLLGSFLAGCSDPIVPERSPTTIAPLPGNLQGDQTPASRFQVSIDISGSFPKMFVPFLTEKFRMLASIVDQVIAID